MRAIGSRILRYYALLAVVLLPLAFVFPAHAATYYIQADTTTPLGSDGTANLPNANNVSVPTTSVAAGTWRATFTTVAPTGSDTQIRNAISGTAWAHLAYVYLTADYGGNCQITGAPSGNMYLRSPSTSDQFRFVLIDYDPSTGSKNPLVTSSVINSPGTTATLRTVTFASGTYNIQVDHRLVLEIQFKPNTSGNTGRVYCNSTNYPSMINVTETITGVTHTITATTGGNGTISPSGAVSVSHHASQAFAFTPDAGYGLKDVQADGVSMGQVNPYTFTNVIADHTINATFLPTYHITANPDPNGTITTSYGSFDIVQGDTPTFTITCNGAYLIGQVNMDGNPQGPMVTYTFDPVTAPHTIDMTCVPTYAITATAGANGTITPGSLNIKQGENQTYSFAPNSGYMVSDVVVDGVSQGALLSYTFTNVYAAHTISVTFTPGYTMSSYAISPPFLAASIPPNVIIQLSVETPMQGAAHQDLTCNGSWTTTYNCSSNAVDIGGQKYVVTNYNNSKDYYGYFDSTKCYTYSGSGSSGTFVPSGPAATHQCGGTAWSGNFLNWATMTAIDAFRKAFTGGNRVYSEDTVGNTVLLGAGQFLSAGYSWYPIRKIGIDTTNTNPSLYMPSSVAPSGTNRWIVRHANGFSVCDNEGCAVKPDPGTGSGEGNFPTTTGTTNVVGAYNLRVKVCDPTYGLEANCNTSNNKPEGVMQKYAARMRFGLFSYTNDNNQNRDGGVLRENMKWINPTIPYGTKYHDVYGALVTCLTGSGCANPEAELTSTGLIKNNPDNYSGGVNSGVINYINKFGYSGYKQNDPASEMYYETIRYWKNLTPSTDNYCNGIGTSNDGFPARCSSSKPASVKANDPYWRDPFIYPCQQSYVIALNDANPWLDKRIPGTAFTSNYGGNAVNDYGVPSNADNTINVLTWTNRVGNYEGLTPGYMNVGCYYTGSACPNFWVSSKYVTELGRVVGTPPWGPKENSYYIAGLAYYARVTDLRPDLGPAGMKHTVTTYVIDTQEPNNGMLVGRNNMLFLAAKYGGFKNVSGTVDAFGNPKPYTDATCGTGTSSNAKCADWDSDGNGIPDNYFFASDPTQIEDGLNSAFSDILKRMSSGTAASILNNSEGSGANLIQALFYPEKDFNGGTKAQWIGEMHALWYYLDPFLQNSTIREDSNDDAFLRLNQDKIVNIYFNGSQTMVDRFTDSNCDGAAEGAAVDTGIVPDAMHSLWKAGYSLFARNIATSPRTIYTTLDKGTLIDFSDTNKSNTTLQAMLQASGATATLIEADTAKIINYIRGEDQPGYRNRTVTTNGITSVWRLGDIISSTPKLQSTIRLNSYNLETPLGYNDNSYNTFVRSSNYQNRGMAYVGANDGMLHAFNLGVLSVAGQTKCQKAHLTGSNLGAEQWAFVPNSALPYLKYYSDPDYLHLYYVDNTVSVLDASINYTPSDATFFPNCSTAMYWNCEKRTRYVTSTTNIDTTNTSWRTVLIGGMGLGGASRLSSDACSTATQCVKAPVPGVGVSSYFALDVSDPASPSLKWEFSDPDLGYSTTGPAVVRIGPKNKNGRWFAVFGSGPTGPIDTVNHQFKGTSDKTLKLFVVDLNATPPFIKGTGPNTPSNANYWVIDTGITDAFAGSLTSAAIDTDRGNAISTGNYSDDAVYVGYVQKAASDWTSGGVGRIFTGENTDPAQWAWHTLISDIASPVTTSVAKAQDRRNGRLWIYFGTGRFYYRSAGSFDDPDTQRAIYGIQEPCYNPLNNGVNRIDPDCTGGSYTVSLGSLHNQSTTVATTLNPGEKGWYINMDTSALGDGYMSERVITDPVSPGNGAVFFTTFRPTFDICGYGGNTYIWAVKYDTGSSALDSALRGQALMQVSTGSFAQVNLSSAFTAKDNRRTGNPIKGVPPTKQGLSLVTAPKPSRKVMQIQEK